MSWQLKSKYDRYQPAVDALYLHTSENANSASPPGNVSSPLHGALSKQPRFHLIFDPSSAHFTRSIDPLHAGRVPLKHTYHASFNHIILLS